MFKPSVTILRFCGFAGFLCLVSCVSDKGKQVFPESLPAAKQKDKKGSREVRDLIAEVDKEIQVESVPENATEAKPQTSPPPAIPIEINSRVEGWVEYFTQDDARRFGEFLNRGETYRPAIIKILKENNVPTELYYLAMIESGFQLHAHSHASAVGLWQFIKPTAIRYGLRVDQFVDERVDPLRATEAAASYLRDLYMVFQNWYLAMAAYNAGELRILNAIMKSKTRDFWQLADEKSLPRETMNYIPKFIAAASIGHHPEKFGFVVTDNGNGDDELELVAVPGGVGLQDVAEAGGLTLADVKKHNPHLKRQVTPPGKNGYQLWLPTGMRDRYAEAYANLASKQVKDLPPVVVEADGKNKWHRVVRGENLEIIAAKYAMSVQMLRQINHLKSSKIMVGQRLRLAPNANATAAVKNKRYRVRRGDNLIKIAEQFGLSLGELKRLNKLSNNKVYVGQRLLVAKEM